jgi:hypothetical protein
VLPGRLGIRFALEALFLVLLAVGAGLADLRPALIVAVMAVAWVLVALVELTAERIARSPVSYLLPAPAPVEEEEPHQVFGPRPEERTVVAPPQPAVVDVPAEEVPAASESAVSEAPPAEPEPVPEPVPALDPEAESLELHPRRRLGSLLRRREGAEEEPSEVAPAPAPEGPPAVAEPEPAAELEREPALDPEAESLELPPRRGFAGLLRRREKEPEPLPEPPPRHVKLLPRRSEPDSSRASQEVAELFGEGDETRKETAG